MSTRASALPAAPRPESPSSPVATAAARGAGAEPLLAVEAVTKRYGERAVLDTVSFGLGVGERVALMGPSGSGKSTLLHCLGGIDRPDTGRIVLGGQDLLTLKPAALAQLRRAAIGHVFQFFHLLPTLTAWENVELPLQLVGVPGRERAARVGELLRRTGVEHRAHALPAQLSGGEMQRVAVARALGPRPRLLLADEPTGNLDTRTGEAVLDLLAELCTEHQTALLLVTHSVEATRICQSTLRLRDGRLVRD